MHCTGKTYLGFPHLIQIGTGAGRYQFALTGPCEPPGLAFLSGGGFP